MTRILIVEDEPSTLNVLSTLLKAEGYEVTPVAQSDEAAELIESQSFDLMLSDIHMTPIDGIELLKRAHQTQPAMAVIMLTGYGTVETAITSLKLGAFDYITKPFKVDELFVTVQKALEAGDLRPSETAGLNPAEQYRFTDMVAASESMRKVCVMIERVAQTEVMVLICGEHGVGKSLAARTLHEISKRREAPFLHVNCAEMTESALIQELFGQSNGNGSPSQDHGAFERGKGGTLYLDGVHTLPIRVQNMLLETIQEKRIRRPDVSAPIPVDVRLITSTDANLEQMVQSGRLRKELRQRLCALPIEIKPLRERPDDILPLVFHFLRRQIGNEQATPTVTPVACTLLQQYRWPGNVRELENVIQHALPSIREGQLGKEALPEQLIAEFRKNGNRFPRKPSEADAYRARALKAFLLEKEKSNLIQTLKTANGDREKAAKLLKVSLSSLNKKMESYGL